MLNTSYGTTANESGLFDLHDIPAGTYTLAVQAIGFRKYIKLVNVPSKKLIIVLNASSGFLEEVVVTGSLREVAKDDSPVNIDIITPKLFQKAAMPNLFEATSLVNGVKPQINCNVCNTGDIHINGLEGPYTLILIDGMPIVSGLSSVYGLMGIPAGMIERLEIAKGPAGALFGSEAMGGTINLITRRAALAPRIYADVFSTTYLENNVDLGWKMKAGKKADWLVGSNLYWFDNKVDINSDNFTDVTLQKRISVFNKIDFNRSNGKLFNLGARYVFEDRWGGEMQWNKSFRGGDSVYGESIYANRAELFSKYEWPCSEKIFTQLSYNLHDQNSVYGTTSFIARQSTAFAQTYWDKQLDNRNSLLAGIAFKNLWYDDNTVVTENARTGTNLPDNSNTIGLFLQNETVFDTLSKHRLLAGIRIDYNNVYRFIPSPRIAYKWAPSYKWIFRINLGTGFRIVNVFTEDHAALTGARDVVFTDRINPEKSYNGSLNAIYKMKVSRTAMLTWDASLFYYHFTNKIFANYDIDPEKIVYSNLDGYAFSRGASLNLSLASPGDFKITTGITLADVQNVTQTDSSLIFSRQLQAPLLSGNLIMSYHFRSPDIKLDVTGNWYGPQRLPIFPNDHRPEYSPWFALLNLQVTKVMKKGFEGYAGIKNLLNFLPADPIMRAHDPFDKFVADKESNPQSYTFDPSYNYAPMQGIRGYIGVRYTLQ